MEHQDYSVPGLGGSMNPQAQASAGKKGDASLITSLAIESVSRQKNMQPRAPQIRPSENSASSCINPLRWCDTSAPNK